MGVAKGDARNLHYSSDRGIRFRGIGFRDNGKQNGSYTFRI